MRLETTTQKLAAAQDTLSTAQAGTASDTGLAAKAFQQLGLNITDLQKMSPDQQFMTIANALANVTDKTQQSALAQAVLGKIGKLIYYRCYQMARQDCNQ